MFKRIKSPVGETVSDLSYSKGFVAMSGLEAIREYRRYVSTVVSHFGTRPIDIAVRFTPMAFADWLEAQGVRLV